MANPEVTYHPSTKQIFVEDAYGIKDELKLAGFIFDSISTDWMLVVKSLDEAIEKLSQVRAFGTHLPEAIDKFIVAINEPNRPEENKTLIRDKVLKSKLGF